MSARPWLLGLLLGAAACSSRPGMNLSTRPDDAVRLRNPAYYDALEAYTRHDAIYDGLDQRVFLAATWEAWPFRQERVEATADFLHLSAAETQARLQAERAEAARYLDFFVGMYTAESEWNDLAAPDSIWRVELEAADGSTLLPVAIERVSRPDANVQALYPYLTPFWIGYRVRFEALDEAGTAKLPAGAGKLTLRLSSAIGKSEPTWVFEGR